MIRNVWVASWWILGLLYLIDWFVAQSKCRTDEKLWMFTPFWPYRLSAFNEEASTLLRRVRVYYGVAGMLLILWVANVVPASAQRIEYVPCVATLVAFDEAAPWHTRVGDSDVDGVAPEANFEILEPSGYAGMQVRVGFLFSERLGLLGDLHQHIGKQFLLELPKGDLDGLFSFAVSAEAIGRIELLTVTE